MNELVLNQRDTVGTSRRSFMVGLSAAAVLALPACSTMSGFGLTDAIRRILTLSSERAFARLTADGGFWDEQVAQIGFGTLLGARGDVLSSILTSSLIKSRLEGAFADIAIEGAYRAAPVVADAVRVIGIENAVALVRGDPTAATGFLRDELGGQLVETMVPELGNALRLAQDPLVGQVLASLSGVNMSQAASSIGTRVNDVIWTEIGREESAIRANPRSTNDPLIIGVFGTGL